MNQSTLPFHMLLLLVVIVAFQILFGIDGAALLDPDEPVYSETAKEMIRFGDYLSPRIYNEYWYDKPPIFYWLLVGSFKIFGGFSELAARIPASLMAIGATLITAVSAGRLFNSQTGFWTGITMGTSIMMAYMGKASVTDTTLLFFFTVTMLAFIHERYWLMYVCCGLAVMTKGPIGIVFPIAIIGLYLLAVGDLRRLLRMNVPQGLLIVLAIGLPWYLYMYQNHGMQFIYDFIGFHNVERFTAPLHPVRAKWWFYLPVLILGLFPWTALFVQGVKAAFTKASGEAWDLMTFFQIWWVFVLIFFSIAQTKQVSYMLLLAPPVAIITGWHLDRLLDNWSTQQRWWGLWSGLLFLLLGVGWIIGGGELPEMAFGAMMLGIAVLLIGTGVVFCIENRHHHRAVWLHVGAGMLTMMVVFGSLIPVIQGRFSSKALAAAYLSKYHAEVAGAERVLYVDKFLRPGVMLYTDVPGIEADTNSRESLKALREDNRPKYIIMRELMYDKMKAEIGGEDWELVDNLAGMCIFREY